MALDNEPEELDAAIEEYEAMQEGVDLAKATGKEDISAEEKITPPATTTAEQTKEIERLLKDASAILMALQRELRRMDESIKTLPRETARLQDASAQIACIANGLSDDIKRQSLEKYQSILEDVGKNFNRLIHEADEWQRTHEKALRAKKERSCNAVIWSAVSMPILMILFFIYLVNRQ